MSMGIPDDLRRAIQRVRDSEYTVCIGSNQHVVHPVEWERGGLAVCAGCGTVVDLGPR